MVFVNDAPAKPCNGQNSDTEQTLYEQISLEYYIRLCIRLGTTAEALCHTRKTCDVIRGRVRLSRRQADSALNYISFDRDLLSNR